LDCFLSLAFEVLVMVVELLASRVTIGHCVIVNEIDRPGSVLIAVIEAFDGRLTKMRYLSRNVSTRREGHFALGNYERIVPVNVFGVRVLCDPVENHYWTERVNDGEAKYADGSPRAWQDPYCDSGVQFAVMADPAVLEFALAAANARTAGVVGG
jgi:hypothetical protein